MRLLIVPLVLTLAAPACAPRPLTPEVAARVCAEEAGLAQRPRGTVGVGVGSGGVTGGVGVVVSPDFLLRRNPKDVYDACFVRRTGFPPMAPQ